MSKKKTKVTYENLDKALREKIDLESIGDETKQKEYINRLLNAVRKYKSSIQKLHTTFSMGKKGKEMQDAVNMEIEAGADLESVLEEVGIKEDDAHEFMKKFIPASVLTPELAKNLKEIKEQMKKAEEQAQQQPEENTQGEEAEETKPDEEKGEEELAESEATTELGPSASGNPTVDELGEDEKAVHGSDESKDETVIETESEVIEQKDETARQVFGSMVGTVKDLYQQKRDLKEKSKPKPIGTGVVDVCKWARDILLEKIIVDDITYLDHNIMLGTAFVATTAVVLIPGYVAGKVVGKTIKGVAKLGAKTIGGAGKLIGKAFKAAKGTAKKCKAKADKKRENRIKNAKKSLSEAKEVVSVLKEYSKAKKASAIQATDEFEYDSLPDRQKRYIEQLMSEDEDERAKLEETVEQENEDLLVKANRSLRNLRFRKISKEFQDRLGLDEISLGELMRNVRINKQGELVETGDLPVSLEEIKEAGLYDELKEVKEIPKVNEFSENDIRYIMDFLTDDAMMPYLDEFVENNEISPEAAEYVIKIKEAFKQGYISIADIERVTDVLKILEINNSVLKEAYSRDLDDMTEQLSSQILSMEQEFEQIQAEEDKKDSKKKGSRKADSRREELGKIAKAKVESLIDAGIVEIVQGEHGREVQMIARGRDELALTDDLAYTTDIKRRRVEQKPKQEHEQEDTEHDDDL